MRRMHVTNIHFQSRINTHGDAVRLVPSGGSEAFEKPPRDEATTRRTKRGASERKKKKKRAVAGSVRAISN